MKDGGPFILPYPTFITLNAKLFFAFLCLLWFPYDVDRKGELQAVYSYQGKMNSIYRNKKIYIIWAPHNPGDIMANKRQVCLVFK